jgi:hypothetical protein
MKDRQAQKAISRGMIDLGSGLIEGNNAFTQQGVNGLSAANTNRR